jgi:hypothetical protein
VRGDDDDGNISGARLVLQSLEQVQPLIGGHGDVEKDQLGVPDYCPLECVVFTECTLELELIVLEARTQQLVHVDGVVDNQHLRLALVHGSDQVRHALASPS